MKMLAPIYFMLLCNAARELHIFVVQLNGIKKLNFAFLAVFSQGTMGQISNEILETSYIL